MLRLARPPTTDLELHAVIKALWGITLPNVRVCPDHVSPFEAVAHAYFAREPGYAVWYASRGSGKSLALAALGLTKTFILDVDTTILGGSMTQSQNVREHMSKLLEFKRAPVYAMRKSTATAITTTTGRLLRPLPASQTTVRGPHPPLSLLDEIDEMEWSIYEAALGQAMEQINSRGELIGEYIVASSTWQNPEGTMTKVIDDARDKGLPVFTWCLAAGSKVMTDQGWVPIESVNPGMLAWTRSGWHRVTDAWCSGIKQTLKLTFDDGTVLECTESHEIATPRGFLRAGLLAPGMEVIAHTGSTDSVLPIRPDPDVAGVGHIVSAATSLGALTVDPGTAGVLAVSDDLQMSNVDAQSEAAYVVQHHLWRDGSYATLPDNAVSTATALSQGVLRDAVGATTTVRPADAFVGVDVEQRPVDSLTLRHVVMVAHSEVQPVYDITVEDAHEFVANGIVVHNCWRELLKTPGNPYGWMSQRFINQKKRAVTHQMWVTEYELNEPSGTDRAVDLDMVEKYFMVYPEPLRHITHGDNDEEWVWEEWEPSGEYHVGADWAKSIDKTIIVVIRVDGPVRRVVYLRRVNKHPYPVMIGWFDAACAKYNAQGQHDITGLGSVVHDFSEAASADGSQVKGFDFRAAKKRTEMLLDYIVDFEHGAYLLPKAIPSQEPGTNKGLTPFYRAHRNVTNADVFAPSKWDAHLPDDFAAMALAHRSAGKIPVVSAEGVPKNNEPRKVDAPFHVVPESGQHFEEMGGVTIVDERYDNSGTFWLPAEG